MPLDAPAVPSITRVRHDVRRRTARIAHIERVTPGMLRLTATGDDLRDFTSLGFDDHIKLIVPIEADEPVRRDYTPRRFDAATGTLVLDFALHGATDAAGPATRWALDARPGDALHVAGPKGSKLVPQDVRRFVLIGDETALPAIGRHIEEAPAGTRIVSVVATTGPDEHQRFVSAADLTTVWAHRPAIDAHDPSALLALVRAVTIEPDTYVWIAAEAHVARALRDYFVNEASHPRGWLHASGYWLKGHADAHEKL